MPLQVEAAPGLQAELARTAEQQVSQALAAEANRRVGRDGEAEAARGVLPIGKRPGAALHQQSRPNCLAPVAVLHAVRELQGGLHRILGVDKGRYMQLKLPEVVPQAHVRDGSGIEVRVVEAQVLGRGLAVARVSAVLLAGQALHGQSQGLREVRSHGVRNGVLGVVGQLAPVRDRARRDGERFLWGLPDAVRVKVVAEVVGQCLRTLVNAGHRDLAPTRQILGELHPAAFQVRRRNERGEIVLHERIEAVGGDLAVRER